MMTNIGDRITRFSRSWAGFILVSLIAGPLDPFVYVAEAQLLPPVQWSGSVLSEVIPTPVPYPLLTKSEDVIGAGTVSQDLTGGSGEVHNLFSGSLGSSPSLSASVILNSTPGGFAVHGRINPVLVYAFEITGPAGIVPIIVHATGSNSGSAQPPTDGTGNDHTGADFSVYQADGALTDTIGGISRVLYNNGGDPLVHITGTFEGGFNGNFSVGGVYTAHTNTVYYVKLALDVEAEMDGGMLSGSGLGETETYSALVDPTFSIDSSAVDPSLYSIVFSPGVGDGTVPTSAVPEPSTYGIAMGLFLLVIVSLRKIGSVRRRETAT